MWLLAKTRAREPGAQREAGRLRPGPRPGADSGRGQSSCLSLLRDPAAPHVIKVGSWVKSGADLNEYELILLLGENSVT